MRIAVAALVAVVVWPHSLTAQSPSLITHPVYVELRNLTVTGEGLQVKELVLAKDAATFTLTARCT